ncbi:hypothetical protein IJ843_03590 [bacterium]|nr:hypothetical protein [bacterium]
MKKLIILFILLIFAMPVFAKNTADSSGKNHVTIEDELVKSKHFYKRIKPVHIKNSSPIVDELIEPYTDKDNVFKLNIYTQGQYEEQKIEDELISPEFVTNASNYVIIKKEAPDDLFIEKRIDTKKVRHIKAKTKYDFTKKQIPINIKIAKKFSPKNGTIEGDTIPFVAIHDFEINGKKFKKGTTVLGRVETISDSDKMGVPECIKIDNFYINDEKEINLHGSVSKTGANRSIWVYPLYQAGNICFYVAGFVFVPIHGGHAKLSTEEIFTVYYETQ